MTEQPKSRYQPGSWIAVVGAAGAGLLVDAAPSGPWIARCWLALGQAEPDTDAALEEVLRATAADGASGGFVFVHTTADSTRVAVRGRAVAEITDSDGVVRLVRHEDGAGLTELTELTLPGEHVGVRLVSAIDGGRSDADLACLPIGSGVVMASVVEYAREVAASAPRPVSSAPVEPLVEPLPVEPLIEPIAEPAADQAYLDDFMEPGHSVAAAPEQPPARDPLESTTQARVVEAADLDWMSRPADDAVPEPARTLPPEPVAPQREPAVSAPEAGLEPQPVAPVQQPAPPVVSMSVPMPAALAESFDDFRPGPPSPMPVRPVPAPAPTPTPPSPMFGATDQPLVQAVRCPSGHLTSAESAWCRVCRAAVHPQETVTVARPSLGRLRLSNGEVYALDRDAVFGRKPEIPVGRPGPRPNAIALTDDRDVSRSHLEIRLDGWRVLALDLGSMNGTRLAGPNLAPQLLPSGTAQEIGPGSVLTLAPDVWIYFEEDQ